MSNLPFNVAGSLSQAIRLATGVYADPSPQIVTEGAAGGSSRRRRLWELPHRTHCPLIGVCFSCDELRALMRKVMHFPADTSDYLLHTTAVGNCEQRSRLAELLQRTLEQRYRMAVKSLHGVRDEALLRAAWRRGCADGIGVPGLLWACWTHPALTAELEQEIYGDIHMLQHQLGSGTRADLKMLQGLHGETQALRRQLAVANAALAEARQEKADAQRACEQETAALRAELTAVTASGDRLARELQRLHEELPDLRQSQQLLRRIASLEMQAEAMRQRNALLEREVERQREIVRLADEAIGALERGATDLDDDLAGPGLCCKRVLCVGGRSGSLRSYREIVEQSGGEFLHHDGGLEESPHRIDSVVAAADIVICQAGCISHNAYWRVKEHCKRTGKRCVFVKNAGVSSFDRAVDTAGRAEGVSPVSPDSPSSKSR